MAMRMTRKKQTPTKLHKTSQSVKKKAPLGEHLQELKRRLIYVAVSVAVGSGIAYSVEPHLIATLLRPSHGEHFVYTSPMGGVNFIFTVCIYVGIALSIPIIVFNALQFLLPLMRSTTKRFIYFCSIASGIVAICGILFGYYAGLPAALGFLLHQFHNSQVSALISIQSYFSFVTAYMVGAAIMFQLPLLLIIINRITPLKPSQMFKAERAVILFAFIAAFIMNPTPNVIDQLLVVVPIVLMYQMGIGLVWMINRQDGKIRYRPLFEADLEKQKARMHQAATAQPLLPKTFDENILTTVEPEISSTRVIADEQTPPVSKDVVIAESLVEPVTLPLRTYSGGYIPTTVRRTNFQMQSSRLIQ